MHVFAIQLGTAAAMHSETLSVRSWSVSFHFALLSTVRLQGHSLNRDLEPQS